MANIDCAHGFEWVKNPHSGDETPRIEHFTAGRAEYAVTLYRGEPVMLDATEGTLVPLNGTYATDAATPTFLGICQEYVVLAAGSLQYNVPVVLGANSWFRVQADDDFTCANRAAFDVILAQANEYAITAFATGNALGNSVAELDGNGAADPSYLRIVGYDTRPDNAFGAHMELYVRFNDLLFRRGVEFVDIA